MTTAALLGAELLFWYLASDAAKEGRRAAVNAYAFGAMLFLLAALIL